MRYCPVEVSWSMNMFFFCVNGEFKCNRLVVHFNPGSDNCGSIQILKLCCG